jgi:hypothetical protein
VENIGNFTRNPIIVISQNTVLVEKKCGNWSSVGIGIIKLLEYKYMEQNIINIGREAVMVYNIKYILA